MHTCDFVHKNIRPDNVLIFTDDVPPGEDSAEYTYPRVIGEPFLVGFDNVRKAIAASNMIKVEDWKKNIYLHPDRHRMGAGDEYTVRHDVYSLGVVLLEIAMWGSFTDQRPGKMARYVWQDAGTRAAAPLSPEDLKKRYLKLAKSVVPRQIGTKYADIVVSCLEGLQDEERGGLLNDEDGLVIETAYVAQVLSKLEEISL
jgi:serine/threonine protein kinase